MPKQRRNSEKDFRIDDFALTPEEVAKILRVNPRTVTNWLRSGEVPGFRAGRCWRIAASVVQKLMTGELELKFVQEKNEKKKMSGRRAKNKRRSIKKVAPESDKKHQSPGIEMATGCGACRVVPTSLHHMLGVTEGKEAEALSRDLKKSRRRHEKMARMTAPKDKVC